MSCTTTPEPSISGATSATSDMRTLSSCSSLPAGFGGASSGRSSTLPTSSTHSVHATRTTAKMMLLPKSASTHGPSSSTKKKKSNNRSSGLARQKRNSWMRSSVVRRAATVVDEEVAALCEKSPFLNSCTAGNSKEIALFHRLEIQLGEAIGRGGFAEVFTIDGFSIDDNNNQNPDDADEKEARRLACQASVTTSSGRPSYAIKFLRKKLLSNTREFQHAAIDLAVESKYLAALSHRHIIKIRGLTRGGTAAFRTGKHDDFFIIMDHLQETLETRLQRWQRRHAASSDEEDLDSDAYNTEGSHPPLHNDSAGGGANNNPPQRYYQRTLRYAHQIADALAYLHDKSIVYRDLKPSNLGFRERDVIQLFDFGLCRELPKPKGQAAHDEDMEDEETFHMSGVGTQRYMAPEIINTRRYNLKADVYSLSMVALEMMTWKKPFSEYTPEEHTKIVAGRGQRPRLVMDTKELMASDATLPMDESATTQECLSDLSDQSYQQPQAPHKKPQSVLVADWPAGMKDLLEEAWTQDVSERLTMKAVFDRLGNIVEQFDRGGSSSKASAAPLEATTTTSVRDEKLESDYYQRRGWEEREVVLEFPSHFSPRHQLSASCRQRQYQQQQSQLQHISLSQPSTCHIDDSGERWFCGDRQHSDASSSMQELTMTSASTTMHDSTATSRV